MKNSFAFYQGASPGVGNFGARMAAAAARRGGDEMSGMKDAAHMDLYEAQAEEARNKAAAGAARNAALADDAGGLAALGGIAAPLAQKAAEYFRTGKLVYQPLTPNDDEGNAMPAAETVGTPPELAAHMPRLDRARQTLWAARAGGGNADQLSKAAGNFQEQGITDQVQSDIGRAGITNPVDLASARNQGGKIGQKIDRFSTGAGGMTINDATGETVAGAVNNKAVADLRATLSAAGLDPDGPAAKELYKQLAVKMVTHPGILPEKAPQGYRYGTGGTLEAIPGGPADVKSGEAAERADERRTQRLESNVNKLSTALDKSNAPTFEAILSDIESTVKGLKDIPGYGQTGWLPNFMLSDAGKDLRRKIASLRNVELKDRSGAAVTDNELRRYLEELGTGTGMTDADLVAALGQVRKRFNPMKQNLVAGFDDETLGEYQARGGMKLERGPGAPPAGGAAPAARKSSAPAASGGRPPLSAFENGGTAPGAAPRAQPAKVSVGQGPKADRIAILQDEYDREAALVPKDKADAFRKQVNLDSLARELRALGVKVGGI